MLSTFRRCNSAINGLISLSLTNGISEVAVWAFCMLFLCFLGIFYSIAAHLEKNMPIQATLRGPDV
jgi:hypothetical protein